MTEAQQSPKAIKPSKGPQKIYPRVVYARVTDQEWNTIQLRANLSGLSMSRYVVEAGLRDKPPPTRADHARLQFLLHQFRRAIISINQVACDRLVMVVGGSDTRQLLRETASLLEQLTQELTQRILEIGTWEKVPDSDGEP